MTNEGLERRIAKLESLIMNESLSEIVSNDMIEKLGEMNKSNQLDNGTFRWAASVNLLSNLIDTMIDDEEVSVDSKEIARLYKSLNKAGYATGADLIHGMIAALDRKMEDFKAAKKSLNEIAKSAKKFDKINK
jgi:hypothetical protein